MILRSLILGIILFLFDLLIFGNQIITQKGIGKGSELEKLKTRLSFVIPITLLIQLFFAIVLLYTFQFLLTFRVFGKDLPGGISFAFLFFVPMLYLLLGSWLWGDKKFDAKFAPSIISWVIKFSVAGIYLGILA